MKMIIPELSLVVLIGPSTSGKSTFAKNHFLPTEILSSDFCRGLVSDSENNQDATDPAFDVLHYIAGKRLELGKLTVIDATNVQEFARKPLISLAKENNFMPVAIVFDIPERICQERNQTRSDGQIPAYTLQNQIRDLKSSLKTLKREGFRYIYIFHKPEEAEEAEIERQHMWTNRSTEHGPFDIIGDVHGCYDELERLVLKLGYQITRDNDNRFCVSHPDYRRLVFLGDLTDRGPRIPEVLQFAMDVTQTSGALCVPGNHDIKLLHQLCGKKVQITHGFGDTLSQLHGKSDLFKGQLKDWLNGLVSHYVLDNGKLVVAHAGMKQAYQGRGSAKVREFALYGETTGETDESNLPIRCDWAADYRGKALVVYGHTPQAVPYRLNHTINIDTGCVFGGNLTAYRYPEDETVSVKSLTCYDQPERPFLESTHTSSLSDQCEILNIDDVLGKRVINTSLLKGITIQEENSSAALEVMGRYAANPKWLIYLPPTMSPSETSKIDGYLEHPLEAFAYYRNHGVTQVVCEQKHMGSRAVVIVCRNKETAKMRFGAGDDSIGICYTRTGRRFFDDGKMETEFLSRIQRTLLRSGFFDDFQIDWVCLDCELMPWSAKAQALLQKQYAPVGVAGEVSLNLAVKALSSALKNKSCDDQVSKQASGQSADVSALLMKYMQRKGAIQKYIQAYRKYCWKADCLDDFKLAPFHILATEGKTHIDKEHIWHMNMIEQYCTGKDPLIIPTDHLLVDLNNEQSIRSAVLWWEELTASGGEGMVVKPFNFIAKDGHKLLQPAIKCRGVEYLRIIYGPEYDTLENLARLKKRSLARKRSLALREFSLGAESLERFVKREPLYRVHECAFGVLALESEPVDQRL